MLHDAVVLAGRHHLESICEERVSINDDGLQIGVKHSKPLMAAVQTTNQSLL